MNRFALMIGAAAVSCALLASCGGSHHMPVQTSGGPPPPPAPPPPPKQLDTAAVLAIVQTQTSETADPFEVDGVIVVTPTGDETSAPINVDAT